MVCNSVSAPVGIFVRSAGMCGDARAEGEVTAAPSCWQMNPLTAVRAFGSLHCHWGKRRRARIRAAADLSIIAHSRARMIDWSCSSSWRKTPSPHDSGESTSTNTTRINSWTTRTRRPSSRDRTPVRWTISSDNILQLSAAGDALLSAFIDYIYSLPYADRS